jgi:hypothetical protein
MQYPADDGFRVIPGVGASRAVFANVGTYFFKQADITFIDFACFLVYRHQLSTPF